MEEKCLALNKAETFREFLPALHRILTEGQNVVSSIVPEQLHRRISGNNKIPSKINNSFQNILILGGKKNLILRLKNYWSNPLLPNPIDSAKGKGQFRYHKKKLINAMLEMYFLGFISYKESGLSPPPSHTLYRIVLTF